MPYLVDCPSCGHLLRVPEEPAGDQYRCPACGNDLDLVGPCPGCGRRIAWLAAACPQCGERLQEDDPETAPWERTGAVRRDCEPHRGSLIHALGTVSLVLGVLGMCGPACLPLSVSGLAATGLGVATWLMARRDLALMQAGRMDPQGRRTTEHGKSYAITAVVLGGLSLLICTGLNLRFFGAWGFRGAWQISF